MLTDLTLSGNYLVININTENIMRILLDGDITTRVSENKIEYVGTGLRIIVNTTPLEWRFEIRTDNIFEIRTDNMLFNVSYVDFPEMPEVLAGLIKRYMDSRQ